MCSSLFRCIALNLFFSLVQSSDFIARKFQIWNEQKKALVPVELIFTEGDQTLFIWKDYEAIGAPERGRYVVASLLLSLKIPLKILGFI